MEVVSSANGDMHDDQGDETANMLLSTRLDAPTHQQYSTPKPVSSSVKIPSFNVSGPDRDYGQDAAGKGHARRKPLQQATTKKKKRHNELIAAGTFAERKQALSARKFANHLSVMVLDEAYHEEESDKPVSKKLKDDAGLKELKLCLFPAVPETEATSKLRQTRLDLNHPRHNDDHDHELLLATEDGQHESSAAKSHQELLANASSDAGRSCRKDAANNVLAPLYQTTSWHD